MIEHSLLSADLGVDVLRRAAADALAGSVRESDDLAIAQKRLAHTSRAMTEHYVRSRQGERVAALDRRLGEVRVAKDRGGYGWDRPTVRAALSLAEVVAPGEAVITLATVWVGETLGVAVAAPITLAFAQ